MMSQALTPNEPANAMQSFIERASRDENFDVAKFEALLRMQREIVQEQERREFNRAMALAQTEMAPIVRDATNTHTRSKYARLETIDREMRPVYTRHGFAVRFGSAPAARDGWVRIVCTVSHVGGYSETNYLDAPPDDVGAKGTATKTAVQGIGSVVSYLRRYLLTMCFNIVLADDPDDDGEAVRRAPNRQSERNDPSPPQGEATEDPDPLDERNGAQWMANLQRLLAGASTVTALVELRRDRRVVRVLAPATGNPPEIRRQIEDAFRAAHERLAHVGEEPDPPDDPIEIVLREIAGMDAATLAGLDASAEWRARVTDVASFPPDRERISAAIAARKASLQRIPT
jgi:ERF superfamily